MRCEASSAACCPWAAVPRRRPTCFLPCCGAFAQVKASIEGVDPPLRIGSGSQVVGLGRGNECGAQPGAVGVVRATNERLERHPAHVDVRVICKYAQQCVLGAPRGDAPQPGNGVFPHLGIVAADECFQRWHAVDPTRGPQDACDATLND